jgi:hypothetical protein
MTLIILKWGQFQYSLLTEKNSSMSCGAMCAPVKGPSQVQMRKPWESSKEQQGGAAAVIYLLLNQ